MTDTNDPPEIEQAFYESLTRHVRPEGSLFPVVGDSALDAHGRNDNVVYHKASENPIIEIFEERDSHDDRPKLDVTNRQRFADWLAENMGNDKCPGFFRRNGLLIRVPRINEEGYVEPKVGDDGPAKIQTIGKPTILQNYLGRKYWPYQESKKIIADDAAPGGEKTRIWREPFPPHFDACKGPVDSPDDYPMLPEVSAVTHTPTLRKDGSVLNEPGYDLNAHTLYLPEPGFEILRHPELGDVDDKWVKWAADTLRYIVEDFPFEHELHKLNYFALLLTPLMRWVVPPPYPMWVITAHQRGTGKSLLARIARTIHGGIHRPELPQDDEEIRKQITSVLTTTTAPIINFDNITKPIRSGQIANLLTTSTWQDRVLGSSRDVSAPNDRLWICTGNNVNIGGDLARRVRFVNIDAAVADPEFRTDFRIKDLPGYVHENRGALITALLVLLMAWVQRGMPVQEGRSDDYGKWTGAMSEILEGAGLDPGGVFAGGEHAIGGVVESDDEVEHGELMELLLEVFGGTEFMIKSLRHKELDPGWAERIEESLPARCLAARDRWKSLGNYMREKEGTVVGEHRFVKVRAGRGGAVYQIQSVGKAANQHLKTK